MNKPQTETIVDDSQEPRQFKKRSLDSNNEDVDEISTDADVSDDYNSASDFGGSYEKIPSAIGQISPNIIEQHLNTDVLAYLDMERSNDKASLNKSKQIWRQADAVCFDVDSTVCCDEAIDELAKYVGKAKEVAELTRTAMMGGTSFREALAKRLDIIRPSREIIAQYLQANKPRLTAHIQELVALLHKLGKDVYLVSGGFDVIIQPAAEILNIPVNNVYANSIKFYYDGSYAGFDKTRPTSNQNGKSLVISMLKQSKGYKNVVMIGDGVTDLEACPPADAFIGFGGNQIRNTVRDNSCWFVYSFQDLITELLQ